MTHALYTAQWFGIEIRPEILKVEKTVIHWAESLFVSGRGALVSLNISAFNKK